MKKLLFVLVCTLSLMSCTNKKGATKALLDGGYTPIEVGDYGWFSCGDDDVFKTRFTATSPDGKREVTGCVCEGWMKGKTIRLD